MFLRSLSFTVAASSAVFLAALFAGSPRSADAASPAPQPGPNAELVHASWQAAAGTPLSPAAADDLYQEKCSMCHGATRAGNPPVFPSLIGVTAKYSDEDITKQIRSGKGKMPAYPSMSDEEVKALILLLKTAPAPPMNPAT